MPLELMRSELAKVMAGEAIGVTRWYDGPCPHEVGARVLLAFRPEPSAQPEVVVEATVMSVRPFRISDRWADHEEARAEGWASAYEWRGHFEQIYSRSWNGDETVHRLQLRVENRVAGVEDSGNPIPFLGDRR